MSGASKLPDVVMGDGDGGKGGKEGKTAGTRGETRRETRSEPIKTSNEKGDSIKASPWVKLAIEAAKAIQKTPYEDITEATWTLIQSNMAYILEHITEVNKEKEQLEKQLQQSQKHIASGSSSRSTSGTTTWASIAGSSLRSLSTTGTETASAAICGQKNRKAKALTIRIEDKEQRETV